MRVLHLINGESFAGAERVQDLLGQRLPELGVEPTFVSLKPRLFADRRRSKCELIELPMRGRFDLRPARQIVSWQADRAWDIVHTHTPRAALIGAAVARSTGVPMIHHVHSPTARDTENPWRNRLNSWVERLAMRGAQRILAVSPSLIAYLREQGAAGSRVRLVMNGVPTPAPLPARPAPVHRAVVGCMALFRPRKGLEVLIQAFAVLMRDSDLDLGLRLVGGFETSAYETQMRQLAETLGVAERIEWRGFRSDVNAELATMDAFVLPSLYGEGMPMVLLEAMAAGVPCVASAIEGIPTLLDNGDAGLLVPVGEPDALAEGIRRLLKVPRLWGAIRSAAYVRQCSCFSDMSMARQIADIYAEVVPT